MISATHPYPRRPLSLPFLLSHSAKGQVGGGGAHAGSLVDFTRKTGADLALLEAKAAKPKRRQGSSSSSSKKRSRNTGGGNGEGSGDDLLDTIDEDDDDDDMSYGPDVSITDEFGRDRTVTRGGPEHRAYLEAKRAAAESEAQQKAEAEAYDERYSYRGNKGSVPPPAAAAGETSAASGAWAWSSGTGRGADEGEFETREGQERRAKKELTKLVERMGGDVVDKDVGGAKVREASVHLGLVAYR